MRSGTRTVNSCRLNKWFTSEFPVDYSHRYTTGEGRKTQRPKCYDKNNKDKDNIPNKNNVNSNLMF